jgi:hypothetical protein
MAQFFTKSPFHSLAKIGCSLTGRLCGKYREESQGWAESLAGAGHLHVEAGAAIKLEFCTLHFPCLACAGSLSCWRRLLLMCQCFCVSGEGLYVHLRGVANPGLNLDFAHSGDER